MMKFFGYFWMIFALYFIFAHPAIIYYNIPTGNVAENNPTLALLYLAIAVVGWVIVLVVIAVAIYKYTFGQRKQILKLLQEGRSIPSSILKNLSSKPQSDQTIRQELIVSFTNFAKEEVNHTLLVNDSKPELKRYEVGRKLRLRVDEHLRLRPYILPEDSQVKINVPQLFVLYGLWFVLAIGMVAYFVYAYQTESQGYGWRFLTVYHPLLLSMFIIVGMGVPFYFVVFKVFAPKLAGMKSPDKMNLLLHGHKATAMVQEATQTGTYINQQPEIKYALSYTDQKGNIHQVVTKKIVSLMDLHQAQQPTRVIFYLPNSPHVIAFEEDIQSLS